MKKRPTIALSMIVKNEAHNLGPLFSSIQGCFDEIHITDTGSTDNTVEILKSDKIQELAGCPVIVHHFEWCDDFAKARQHGYDLIGDNIDYIMWMDGDDVLSDKDAFKHWRDNTMHCAHYWLVNYNYAYDGGRPVATFFRERITKNNHGYFWNYFLHEGLINDGKRKVTQQFCPSFTINHMRTEDDIKADRSRNITIFEKHIASGEEFPPRMHYYYGKELFDNGDYAKAVDILQKVCAYGPEIDLQIHDRVMAQQCLALSYGQCGKWDHSLNVALNGLQLEPGRAELFICIGEALSQLQKVNEAKLFFEAAKHCQGGDVGGSIYSSPVARDIYPSERLAEIYINQYNIEAAERELETLKACNSPNVDQIQQRIDMIKTKNVMPQEGELLHTEDIVITTPPQSIVGEWDELVLQQKGLGGSETACVEIARQLKKQTGRPVKVFMPRKTRDIMPSGVEYIPFSHLEGYFRKYKPFRHIAWRHTFNLTPALTYVWSHDLMTRNVQSTKNYHKLWCLTEFHKNFVHDMARIPKDKIDLVRNGIDPELFKKVEATKIPYKVIFSSSPDRGWKQSIEICKIAREKVPNLELHLFYGTQNMRSMGMTAEADELDGLVREHDWVHFHGFVSKEELVKQFKESAVWLYPADFIETSCITAMESLCAGTYPLVRNMGALRYTLGDAIEKDMCTILDTDPCDMKSYQEWADELVHTIEMGLWRNVNVDLNQYSWETVTKDYIQSMNL